MCIFRLVFSDLYCTRCIFPYGIFRVLFLQFVLSDVISPLVFLNCILGLVSPDLYLPIYIFWIVFSDVYFKMVCSDLYVFDFYFPNCIPWLELPRVVFPDCILQICIFSTSISRSVFSDLYFQFVISTYIFRFDLYLLELDFPNFSAMHFRMVFSRMYFSNCISRF